MSTTFADTWHRLAPLRIALRPQVRVHRQTVRGERWFVLHDPLANQFFRVRRAAWALLSRCDGRRTLDALWREAMERDPDGAPGQQELLQLLAQLHAANLIAADVPADTRKLFERQRKRVERERTARWLGFMFARFPLINPDPFLRRALPLVGWVFSWPGLVVWALWVLWGVKTLIEERAGLADQAQGVLAPGNLPLLYLSMVGLALLHEMGHAFACRRHGGQVTTMGVMLLIFTPLPYVDVTASWSFREKRHRLLVGAAGMMTELAVAAGAALVWAASGPGMVQALAFNVMFLASISTLLFNLNPLLRFDGYYLLSDGFDLPNLYSRAQSQVRHLWEKNVLGLPHALPPTEDRREAFWLTFYGVAAAIYRVVLCAGIVLFVAGRFLLIGVLMALFCVVAWLLVPVGRGLHYLVTSPALDRRRLRAWGGVAAVAGVAIVLLGLVPLPRTVRVPGVVQASEHAWVVAEAPGRVAEILTPSGRTVTAGQGLLRLENPELSLELEAARARLTEARARSRASLREGATYHTTALRYEESVARQVAYLEQQVAALVVRARQGGWWSAPDLADRPGMVLARGTALGEVVAGGRDFVAVVPQGRASALFEGDRPLRGVKVRLRGRIDETWREARPEILDGERFMLPSASLGWAGGGPVEVREDGGRGVTAVEPFFAVRVRLAEATEGEAPLPPHGQTGRMLLARPAAPAAVQLWEAGRRLVQRRFQF